MIHVPIIRCPHCNKALLEEHLNVPFAAGSRFTVACKDHFGNGCGTQFDVTFSEKPITQKRGLLKRLIGMSKEVTTGTQLIAKITVRHGK